MRAKRNKTAEDFFEFLKEVYNKTSKNEHILMSKTLTKHGINTRTASCMISDGIIRNEGNRAKPKYVWCTCIPHIKMARSLYEKVYSLIKRTNDSRKGRTISTPLSKQMIVNTSHADSFIPAWTLQDRNGSEEENAVILLKGLGYKIMKPITQWEEI